MERKLEDMVRINVWRLVKKLLNAESSGRRPRAVLPVRLNKKCRQLVQSSSLGSITSQSQLQIPKKSTIRFVVPLPHEYRRLVQSSFLYVLLIHLNKKYRRQVQSSSRGSFSSQSQLQVPKTSQFAGQYYQSI